MRYSAQFPSLVTCHLQGLFSCQAAPVHPATCIYFLVSPGMVAILILSVKVQKRLGVPEGFMLYPRLWGWEMLCCLPPGQPLGEGQVWPLLSLFPSQQVRVCGGHRGQAGHTMGMPLPKEGLRVMAVGIPLAVRGCARETAELVFSAALEGWTKAMQTHVCTRPAAGKAQRNGRADRSHLPCLCLLVQMWIIVLYCQSLLRGNGQAQPSPAESGKANLPWKKHHLQWQLGTTACCGLSHMCLLENLCSCITPSQLTQLGLSWLLEDIKHGVIVGKQGGLDCSDGIGFSFTPTGKKAASFLP